MDEQDLERTEQMKTMIIERGYEEDDQSILESIEEFEDKIDYLDIDEKKKEKLREMCEKIKEEENEETREYLFNLLQSELD